MRIGIDARMYGPKVGGGGLGRYIEQLVKNLNMLKDKNRFVLFLKPENAKDCKADKNRFEKRIVDIHWYGIKEQLLLASKIDAQKLDLIHFPHWNVPLNLKTPFIITIHDLILLEQPHSARITTRNPLLYKLKYWGFKRVLRSAIKRAKHIIAVSDFTKSSILKHFPGTDPNKITVIHEGVTTLETHDQKDCNIDLPKDPYFLYVGNAYPHKNLESLLHAFSFFTKLHPKITLVLAGRKDVFYQRLKKEVDEIGIPEERVHFIMSPSDAELHELYRHAMLYLFPSRMEGFGLPPLEAMQEGIPVAAARAGSLPEILGDAAMYFHPDDIEEMVRIMETTLEDESLRKDLIKKGKKQIKQYSWKKMAEEISKIYAA